jgi:hypothetical protein
MRTSEQLTVEEKIAKFDDARLRKKEANKRYFKKNKARLDMEKEKKLLENPIILTQKQQTKKANNKKYYLMKKLEKSTQTQEVSV